MGMSNSTQDEKFSIRLPFGVAQISLDAEGAVSEIDLLAKSARLSPPESAAARRAAVQVAEYLKRAETDCRVPLAPSGTPFQQRVWQALRDIPPGEVRTYGELAKQLHSAPRAVGQACRRNPIPILIPCHRVVSANGIGGFSGQTAGPALARKRWLLRHEGWQG